LSRYYVGIDPSTTNTGMVILDESGDVVSMTLHSSKCKVLTDRVRDILTSIITILDEFKNDDLYVWIEAPFYMRRLGSIPLIQANGAFFYTILMEYGCLIHQPSPTSVKKFATGSGKATKDDMTAAVPKPILNKIEKSFKKKSDDVVDAYHIAKMAFKDAK
jgi:Holliday junction resolvasome RuvABC endonuclease subunit